MKDYTTTYVGLDAHKKNHQLYIIFPNGKKPEQMTINNTSHDIRRFVRGIQKKAPGPIRICYEAGPCGFDLKRQLETKRIRCDVVAPSLIPIRPGERIKTDKKDAKKLAEYSMKEMLTFVHPPSEQEEGIRDLCRCREAAKDAQKRAQQQLMKFLLRHGRVYSEGSYWTQKHFGWLDKVTFADEKTQWVFEEYLIEVKRGLERVHNLEKKVEQVSQEEPYKEPVGWLRCFRGIDTVTAMVIVSELYGFERFTSARQLMAFLGLTPSEYSTGERKRKGAITKTGNQHVRRVLIEASWHQRFSWRISKQLRKRREGQPEWVIAQADKAMKRLSKRYKWLIGREKSSCKAITAVARELAGFIWSVLYTKGEGLNDPKSA
jgi:transposase